MTSRFTSSVSSKIHSRSPSPDHHPSPDKSQKLQIPSTFSPNLPPKPPIKQSLIDKKDEYIRTLQTNNKDLQSQNLKLSSRIRNQSMHSSNNRLSSHASSGKEIATFDALNENEKDVVLSEFNKLMRGVKDQAHARIEELEGRLVFAENSYKKLHELVLHIVKIKTKQRERRNQIKQRNNGYIKDTSHISQQLSSYSIIINQDIENSQTLRSLEEELIFLKKQNLELASELKQVYIKDSRRLSGHERCERELRKCREVIEELRFKLNDREEQNCESMKQFKSFTFGVSLKSNDSKGKAEGDRERVKDMQDLVDELEQERISKEKTERAMELVLHNYQISQQSLDFIKLQNQKLKSINTKMYHQLQQYLVLQKQSRIMIVNQTNTTNLENNLLLSSSPSPSPSPKTSKSPPSSSTPENCQAHLNTKLKHVEYQNQGLHLLRKRYQEENHLFFEDMRALEEIVYRYWDIVVRESGARVERGRKEMEMIQDLIEIIIERLTIGAKEIEELNGLSTEDEYEYK